MQYSNEELAVKIQAGQAGYMPMLWEQVQAFVRLQAARWLRAWQSSRPILEFDDLYQCGYPAMCEAVKTYQADKNMTFIGWLSNYLHTEFSREVGCRTQKQRQDPLANSISLDAPLGGETEDMTLGDTVADQKDQYAAAEADMYNKQLQEIVGEAVDNLPQREQKVLHLRYWEDMTLRRAGECIGVGPERVRQIENKALEHSGRGVHRQASGRPGTDQGTCIQEPASTHGSSPAVVFRSVRSSVGKKQNCGAFAGAERM